MILKTINRIRVFTNDGDSPGMNAAVSMTSPLTSVISDGDSPDMIAAVSVVVRTSLNINRELLELAKVLS